MTAAFFERDSLYEDACRYFQVVPASVSMFRKPDRKAARKREQISRTIEKFRRVMSSRNPPRTKQQAVEAVSPILVLVLSMFVEQFAIKVIEWLWDQTDSQDSEQQEPQQ